MSNHVAESSGSGWGSSSDPWHSVDLKIPFLTHQHAVVAKKALEVDREQNQMFVERTLMVEDNILAIQYRATTVRLLRLSTNSFLSSVDLVLRTMSEFAPDPSIPDPTDQELEEIRRAANSGNIKGIELRGDGKGAGSGEEIKA